MKAQAIEVTIHTYNALILCASKRYGYYLQSFDYYEEMVARGIQPDLLTYNALMVGCARYGDVSNAQLLFNQLPAVGIEPNEFTYATLIDAVASSQVKHKLRVAKSYELTQNERITYALELFDEMKHQKKLPVTLRAVNALVKVHAHALRMNRTIDLFDRIYTENGLEPDYVSYRILFK